MGRALHLRFALCGLVLVHAMASGSAVTEHDLKAAYLLNVLKFAERRSGPVDPEYLTLCLVAPGPIEKPLGTLGDSGVRGRKLRVRLVGPGRDLQGCEVVFVGRSSGHRPLLDKANALGILTIGNDSEFVAMSGMMALIVENRRILVEINRHAVKGGDWVISSHLLEIARIGGAAR
jgi:YfiR/HmsC-like